MIRCKSKIKNHSESNQIIEMEADWEQMEVELWWDSIRSWAHNITKVTVKPKQSTRTTKWMKSQWFWLHNQLNNSNKVNIFKWCSKCNTTKWLRIQAWWASSKTVSARIWTILLIKIEDRLSCKVHHLNNKKLWKKFCLRRLENIHL